MTTPTITLNTTDAAEIMHDPVTVVAKMEQPLEGAVLGSHWEDDHVHFVPGGIIDLPYPKGATVEVRKHGTILTSGTEFQPPIVSIPVLKTVCTARVTDVRVCQYQDIPKHYPELPRNYEGIGSQEWDDNEYVEVLTIERSE